VFAPASQLQEIPRYFFFVKTVLLSMLLNATDPVGLLDRAFADQVPAAPSWLVAAAAWFISNPYYCWALGPIVASFVGWAPSAAFLEWATKQK